MTYSPISISRGGFAFCRWSMAAIMWTAALLRLEWLVAAGAVIMAINALVTVRYAPLVMLYTHTVDRLHSFGEAVVDMSGLRFAHVVAMFAMALPLVAMHVLGAGAQEMCWRVLLFVAGFKTLGALGMCPVSRWYTCLVSKGNCCSFLRGRG